jgi:hypothetical protein
MATVQPRPLELDLLCQKLDADFSNRITGTGNSPEEKRSNFLSKAVAAFVLHEEADPGNLAPDFLPAKEILKHCGTAKLKRQ